VLIIGTFVLWSLFSIYLPASDASLRASDFEFLTEKMGFSVKYYLCMMQCAQHMIRDENGKKRKND
jgi:hypothetical protein